MLSTINTNSVAALAAHEVAPTVEIFSMVSLVIVGTTALLVILCVLVQYEVFSYLTTALKHLQTRRRRKILVLVLSLMLLHVIEIWLFGLAFYVLLDNTAYGALHGGPSNSLLDCVYFSAVLFTTLGLGDLVPSGSIRFIVGTEALSGFILISWSAAFTYLEMQRYWTNE
ncbi:MAG: ion channel [Gammaproteobacteria bacterium]